jgi:hypothetical protein
MRETARLKAELGLAATGLPRGLASEGSFGPHPAIPFLAAAHELMIFIDREEGIEAVEEQVSEATNFAAIDLAPGADLEGFLARAGFPGHALILRSGGRSVKGITARTALDQLFRTARTQNKWQDRPIADHKLEELYDLVKYGPTSANSTGPEGGRRRAVRMGLIRPSSMVARW